MTRPDVQTPQPTHDDDERTAEDTAPEIAADDAGASAFAERAGKAADAEDKP